MWKAYTLLLIIYLAEAGVVVSIPDLKPIVGEIYEGEVEFVLPANADPHLYSPSREDFEKVARSDLCILANSEIISFETEIKRFCKNSLDFSDYNVMILSFPGIGKNYHAYWLYPENAIKIAEKVKDKLIEIQPEKEEFYKTRFERFVEEVRKAQTDAESIVRTVKHYDFIAMDPHTAYAVAALKLNTSFVFPEEVPPSLADIPKKKGNCIVVIAEYQKGTKLEDIGREIARELNCGFSAIDVMTEIRYSSKLISNAAKLSNPEFKNEGNAVSLALGVLGSLALIEALVIVVLWRRLQRKI
ncbi:MAG: zinc ABC transporter substrate-binding protein [Archaeoglobus sp.]|nr:zinc ABC transporter substrate-binding protein [Archaeoglobus sp.]